jgi:hypothetical protein
MPKASSKDETTAFLKASSSSRGRISFSAFMQSLSAAVFSAPNIPAIFSSCERYGTEPC